MYARYLGALALLVLAHGGALAADHSHSHAAPAAGHAAEHGKVLPTDAALRRGMEDIRATMAAALAQRPAAAEYARIADAVEADIDRLTKACQLPPESDARLHLLLASMIDGIEALRGQQKQQAGVSKIVGALDEYGRAFDHPGWRPLGH